MNLFQPLQNTFQGGCFTTEYFLRGLTLKNIFKELGLKQSQLSEGAVIAYALNLPGINEFELGGWTEHSTDKFEEFRNGQRFWNKEKYNEVFFPGSRLSKNDINDYKKAWLDRMNQEKLVKVIPVTSKGEGKWPKGNKAAQIIVSRPILCTVIGHYKPHDYFKGAWG